MKSVLVRAAAGLGFAAVLGLLFAQAACSEQPGYGGGGVVLAAEPDSDLDLGTVADFELTERSGALVTGETLAGNPYITTFFFTRCAGPCPALLGHIRRLQEKLGAESKIRLVSITVDPKHDTQAVLAAHAASFTADPERWLFLTGSEDAIFGLMRDSFHMALERLPDKDSVMGMQITHDTRLIVVDGAGHVRGYYDGKSQDEIDRALERARYLAGE